MSPHLHTHPGLQAYSKLGLLKTREDKHSGDIILTAVNREHELYSEFRPYKLDSSSSSPAATAATATGAGGGGASAAAGAGGGEGGGPAAPLVIEEVFRPSREVKRASTQLAAGSAHRMHGTPADTTHVHQPPAVRCGLKGLFVNR